MKLTRIFPAATLLISLAILSALPQQAPRWYRGNTHTHTTNSDGDSAPADVAEWYKKEGYDFLFITDHEHVTPVDELNEKLGDGGKFLVISGQEITDRFDKKPYHVNGLGLTTVVQPQRGTTIVSNVQKNVDAVRAAGALPQINHPNFGWALTAQDIARIKNAAFMEIHSGHPLVNMAGGGGVPSVESMWDIVLTRGLRIYAVAVDDSHHFKRLGDRTAATPGHGWVMVRAPELTRPAILAALERGDFYASSGVELA
ncbi:MAG TPA: CehA/McbA family metallohydrolase, partial [Pyrinomonadaceae bacterium]|nr:CehA/McbA family metallohydrolase [Pyrinomonadaceae bacterium]